MRWLERAQVQEREDALPSAFAGVAGDEFAGHLEPHTSRICQALPDLPVIVDKGQLEVRSALRLPAI